MSELQKELDKDKAFINKVQERIYYESDDWEDSIAEPEWIIEMTDLADKYLRRFKAAENGRRQVARDKAKLLEMSEPKLNENQKVVLGWLKNQSKNNLAPILMLSKFGWEHFGDELPKDIAKAYQALNDRKDDLEILQAFATWALDQC